MGYSMKTSINQIISARLLLQKARLQSTRTGIEKAFAILYAHDSLDWVLQYLHDDTITPKDRKRMFMVDYARVISKNPDKFGSLDESKCDQLNTMRNNFKHSFVVPNDKQVEEIVLWTEVQINSLIQSYTGKKLSEFDTVDAIADKAVVDKIKESDRCVGNGKPELSLANLAIAYAMLENIKREKVEDMFGVSVPRKDSLTFSNSFFLKLEAALGRDFSRAWDKIVDSVEYQNVMIPADLLGVDHAEYLRFIQDTPHPQRSLSGEYHVDLMPRLVERAKDIDVAYWREFVISTAISNGL